MAKALAVVALAAAVFAALAVLVFVPGTPAPLIAPLYAIGAAIYVLTRRQRTTAIAAGLTIMVAVLGLLAAIETVTISGDGQGESAFVDLLPSSWAPWLGMTASLGVVACLLVARWDELAPWAAYTGAGAAGLAVLLGLVGRRGLVDQSEPITLLVGLLCLVAAAPAVTALRSGDA